MENEMTGCGVCGGAMALIRGRYPNQDKRLVCPTCLAERMDNIRELTDRDYGKAYSMPSDSELPKIKEPPKP